MGRVGGRTMTATVKRNSSGVDVTLDMLRRQSPSGAVPTKLKCATAPPSSGSFARVIGGVMAPLVGSAAVIFIVPASISGTTTTGALSHSPAAVVQDVAVDRRRRSRDDRQTPNNPPESVAASTSEASEVARAVVEEITAADHLFAIQNAFSLSVTQLSEVIGVSRGTLYTWMKGTVDLPRKDVTEARLHELVDLAKEWRRRSSETLGRLVEAPVTPQRESLLALLAAPVPDHSALREVFEVLAQRLDAKAQERRKAADNAPDTIREITAENIEIERLRLRGLGA
jgi:hypothetical protein